MGYNNWEEYAVHNDQEIKGFFGPYRFLSNFKCLAVPIIFNKREFFFTENAFMAAKSLDPVEQMKFCGIRPADAKALGRTIQLRKDWEQVKNDFMFYFNLQKFDFNPDLKKKLLDTGDKYLEELNDWEDVCWGVDINKGGENRLGKILMRVREML